MRNGLIYRKRDNDILFYVPENMECHVLRKYHDEMGHFAPEKTTNYILSNYWFPRMRYKVKTYVANCLECIAFSPSTGKREGYLNPIPKGDSPFLTYHVDYLGPIDKRISSKLHIFLVIDAFTKFIKLYTVKTTETKEAIKCLDDHFRNYSRPRTLISDRGTCFTSQDFKMYVEGNEINHVLIATASPKANGKVERVNIQKEEFEPELLALNRDDNIKLSSSLKTLHPILDEFGIIRLGARLHNAPINYNEKQPIILPRHQSSELIARHAHLRSLDGGSLPRVCYVRDFGFWELVRSSKN